jgi:hypothetical protein
MPDPPKTRLDLLFERLGDGSQSVAETELDRRFSAIPVAVKAQPAAETAVAPPTAGLTPEQLSEEEQLRAEEFAQTSEGRLGSTLGRIYGESGEPDFPPLRKELEKLQRKVAGTGLGWRTEADTLDSAPAPVKNVPGPRGDGQRQALQFASGIPGLYAPAKITEDILDVATGKRGVAEGAGLVGVHALTAPLTALIGPGVAFAESARRMLEFSPGPGVNPDELPVDPSTVSTVGRILSTAGRVGAAVARANAEQQLVEKLGKETGEVDKDTGLPVKVFTDPQSGRVFRSRRPQETMLDIKRAVFPETQRDEASYIDVFRAKSLMDGGTGDEIATVFVPGIAADIGLDLGSYVGFGGSKMSRVVAQVEPIFQRMFGRAHMPDMLARAREASLAIKDLSQTMSRDDLLLEMIGRASQLGDASAEAEIRHLGKALGRAGVTFGVGPLTAEVVTSEQLAGFYGAQGIRDLTRDAALAAADLRAFFKGRRAPTVSVTGKAIAGEPADPIAALHGLPQPEERAAVRTALDDIISQSKKFWDFFSPYEHPGSSIEYRAVAADGSEEMNLMAARQAEFSRGYGDVAQISGVSLPERELIGKTIDAPHSLAYLRSKSLGGFMLRKQDAPDGTSDEVLRDMEMRMRGAYASSIFRAKSAEEAMLLFLQQPFPAPSAQAAAATIGEDWKKYDRMWQDLDPALQRLSTWVNSQFDEMKAERLASGLQDNFVDAYIPHIMRDRQSIMRAAGNINGSSPKERSLHQRAFGSLLELSETHKDPITDALQLLSIYRQGHERLMSTYRFQVKMVQRFGTRLKSTTEAAARREAMKLGNEQIVKVGNDYYGVAEEIKEAHDKVMDLLTPGNPDGPFGSALSVWDRFNAWNKERLTVGRIGFHTRNVVSDAFQAWWLGDVLPGMMTKAKYGPSGTRPIGRFSRAVQTGMIGMLREGESVGAPGRNTRELAKGFRSKTPGMAGEAISAAVDKGRRRMLKEAQKAEQVVVTGVDGHRWRLGEIYDLASRYGVIEKGWTSVDVDSSLYESVLTSDHYGMARRIFNLSPYGKDWVLIRAGRNVGRVRENAFRLATFMDGILEKGMAPEDAGRLAEFTHFNYKALAPADKIIKRLIPFWTWMRKNFPAQILGVMRRPGRASLPYKAKRASQKDYEYEAEERRLEEQFWEPYKQAMYAFPVRRKRMEQVGEAVKAVAGEKSLPAQVFQDYGMEMVFAPDLPYRDLATLDDPMGFLSSFSPLLKAPFELASRKTARGENLRAPVEAPPGMQYILEGLGLAIPAPTVVDREGKAAPGAYVDAESGVPVTLTSRSLMYILNLMHPDIATLGRGIPGDKIVSPQQQQQTAARAMGDITGFGRFWPSSKDELEGRFSKDSEDRLRAVELPKRFEIVPAARPGYTGGVPTPTGVKE